MKVRRRTPSYHINLRTVGTVLAIAGSAVFFGPKVYKAIAEHDRYERTQMARSAWGNPTDSLANTGIDRTTQDRVVLAVKDSVERRLVAIDQRLNELTSTIKHRLGIGEKTDGEKKTL